MVKISNAAFGTSQGIAFEYIPPAQLACKVLGVNAIPLGKGKVTVSAEGLREIFAMILQNITVDEERYKQTNMDVAAAIMSGEVASCREHFIRTGYFEGRSPSKPPFNENWYLSRYPDVAQAYDSGTVANVEAHFMENGQQEGRAGIPEHGVASDKWIKLATTTE